MDELLNEIDSSRIERSVQLNILPKLEYNARMHGAPHILYKAKVYQDGSAWCCSIGEDPMNGVYGYGETPAKACESFDDIWVTGGKI